MRRTAGENREYVLPQKRLSDQLGVEGAPAVVILAAIVFAVLIGLSHRILFSAAVHAPAGMNSQLVVPFSV
jgi:hypothetical protein